jgi:hypothetical protein
MVGTLMVNRISDRVTVFVVHDHVIVSVYGYEPVVVGLGHELDELITILKRRQLERRLGL